MKRSSSSLLVATAAALIVTACGSSNSSKPTSNAGSASKSGNTTYKVGILVDQTGPASSTNKTVVDGVKAGALYAARQGVRIKYVVGDTQTSPNAALAAAQKLVTQDHVDAVVAESALAFAAAPYLTARGVPVVGAGQDGPEWTTAKNMFSVFGALNNTKVSTTVGNFFKMVGVTNLASIGYGISPISSEAAQQSAQSAKHAGIKIGYLNANLALGTTNVGPAVLAMKDANIDGFTASVDSNTAFAAITALRQQGVDLKASALATGYGGDLLTAGPGAQKAAQGVYFYLGFEPVEMQTAATKQFVDDLEATGVKGSPTYAEYNGYTSVGLLVRALKSANSTDKSQIIHTLSGIHDWNGLGLFGAHTVNLSDRTTLVSGVDNCIWFTKLVGNEFQVVKGAAPVCGTVIPGVTVKPAS